MRLLAVAVICGIITIFVSAAINLVDILEWTRKRWHNKK